MPVIESVDYLFRRQIWPGDCLSRQFFGMNSGMAHPAIIMSDKDQVWIGMYIDRSAVRFVFLIILSYSF
jgi:hypothetical protein